MATNIHRKIVLSVSGKEAENSFNGLSQLVGKLGRELKKLTPGTKEFMDKAAELKEARGHFEKVKKEIDLVNGSLQNTGGIIGRLKTGLANFGLGIKDMLLGFGALKLNDVATQLLKVSDAMADVQKTTGMALDEVKQLWDAFDEMDTRTSKMDRLKIAEVGGRLGVPKEQMASFVQEVDKAYVALGDSFQGGLEAVVDSLGKIKGLFEETKGKSYAEAINEVGSALNELAASGTASEGNISDFALRVGALPDALKPSIDKVLGLGAAFEESGVDSQIAASGYSNFVKVAGENLQSFAYSMNMSYTEAQKLFNEKPEEFFLRFAEGMRGVPAEQTAKIFDSLKIGTLEVQKAVGAAANRTDEFRAAMARAGVAMEDANSLNDEFNKKNNNAAAIVEKLKNAFADLFSSSSLIEGFDWLIQLIGSITGVTKSAGDGVKEFKETMVTIIKVITVATVTFFSYRVAIALAATETKNLGRQTLLLTAIQKAQKIVTQIKLFFQLAASVRSVKDAQALLNLTIMANPLTFWVTLITSAITTLVLFKDKLFGAREEVEKLRRAQQVQAEMTAAAEKSVASFENSIKNLIAIIKHEISTKEMRERAYKRLIELHPEFKTTVDDEFRAIDKLQQVYDLLIKKIELKARAEAKAKAKQKLYDEIEENRVKIITMQGEVDKEQQKRNQNRKHNRKALEGLAGQRGDGAGAALNRNANRMREITFQKHNEQTALKNQNIDIEKNIKLLDKQDELRRIELMKIIKNSKNKKEIQIAQYELDVITGVDVTSSSTSHNTIAPTSGGKTNRPTKDEASKKEQDRKKDLEKSQSALEKARKEEIRIAQNLADEKLKILEENEDSEIKAQEQSRQKELTAQREHGEELLKNIKELEEKIKSAKSDEAKTNYENALKKEREAVYKNDLLMAQSEETHQKKISEIKSKYALQRHKKQVDEKQKEIELAFQKKETEIQNITSLEEAKKALSAQNYLTLTKEELRNIQTLEDAKKALREAAAREILAKEIAVMEEQKIKLNELLSDPKISPEALKQLREELEEVDGVLVRMKGQLQQKKGEDEQKATEEENQRKKSIDILGFSAKDWEDMWANFDTTEGKIKGVIMATQALSNAFQRFAKLQQALNEKEMKTFSKNQDEKKKKLLIQLNKGYISQEEYHKGIQKMEEETSEKKKQIQERAARAEKAASLMSAIAGTASAVVGALGMKPWTPVNFALAGIVGALGAVQVATIAAQPIPEFAEGGFTGLGSGKPDRTGFRPVGIVHENEYVTPKWMLQNPVVADVVDWMESIRTGRINLPKGYADGGYTTQEAGGNKQEAKNQPPTANSQLPTAYSVELTAVLHDVKDLLNHLKENGVEAWMVEDAENGKRIKRTIKKFEKIENKNRMR